MKEKKKYEEILIEVIKLLQENDSRKTDRAGNLFMQLKDIFFYTIRNQNIKNEQDKDDIFQEGYRKFQEAAKKGSINLSEPTKALNYVNRIFFNECMDFHRKKNKTDDLDDSVYINEEGNVRKNKKIRNNDNPDFSTSIAISDIEKREAENEKLIKNIFTNKSQAKFFTINKRFNAELFTKKNMLPILRKAFRELKGINATIFVLGVVQEKKCAEIIKEIQVYIQMNGENICKTYLSRARKKFSELINEIQKKQ